MLRVDDGESSLALDEHVALNFPGRLSHLECTGSTKVNRRIVAENNATQSNESQKQRAIKQSYDFAISGFKSRYEIRISASYFSNFTLINAYGAELSLD